MGEKKLSDGSTFQVEPMLATQAIILQARLLKIVGGAVDRLPVVMAGYGDKASPEAKNASNAAAIAAISDIFTQADPNEVAAIIRDLCESGRIKPGTGNFRKVDFDGDFTDRKKDILPVVIFVLREQFGDFFSELRGSGALN